MATEEKVARRKLSLLELAKEMQNVSKACNMIGQTPYSVFKKALPKKPKTGNKKADEKAA